MDRLISFTMSHVLEFLASEYCIHLIIILSLACVFTFADFMIGRKSRRGSNL